MISIVVLAHNKSRYTDACLRSVLETNSSKFELIVSDNGSTDDTPEVLKAIGQLAHSKKIPFKLIRNSSNIGCSTSRNMAVEAAIGDEIVFLDNDTLICDMDWLKKMRDVLYSENDIAFVGPKICYPFEPHLIQCAGVGVSKSGRIQFIGRGEPQDDPRFCKQREVQTLISACYMFKRSLYNQIGGLDEAFNPVQYEDFDFCYRARKAGLKCIYTPDTIVYHWESVTSDGSPAIANRYVIIKNGMLFKKRWRHMFENEDGPSDADTIWQTIEIPSIEGLRRR